jgi:opacity protein-like surface antigen
MRCVQLSVSSLALLVALAPASVNAADIYGGDKGGSLKDAPVYERPYTYYIAVRGGAVFTQDTDFEVLGLNVENQYDEPGYFISGAVGASMAGLGLDGFRGELEVGYFQSDIDAHDVEALGLFEGDDAFGETSGIYGLVNVFYDFKGFGSVTPFLGAGIGAASVEFDGHGVTPVGVVMDDDDVGFAYQLSAGANIALSKEIDLELGYRFLGVTGLELEAVDGTASDIDVENHVVYGGLRFKL